MTFTHFGHRTVILAAGLVLYAASASPQTTAQPPAHDHGYGSHAEPSFDVTARIATLDERIVTLTSDMKMFAGELKVQAMAELLEALVERQALADHERNRMRDRIRDLIDVHRTPPPPAELEPETLCSPYL